MDEHSILGIILLIQTGLLVAGFRIWMLIEREVGKTLAHSEITLEAVTKLLQQKQ